MEAQTNRAIERRPDTDEDIKRKHKLFYQYVVPYENMIYKLVIQYSMQKAYIDDNYVECLVNYYKYIETYNPSMSIRTWLHIICKRFVHDLEERRTRQVQPTDDVNIENSEEFMYEPNNSEDDALNCRKWTEIYNDEEIEALQSLKPIYREAFLLQHAGYKLNEIVEISYRNGNLKSKNIDTIKSRLFLARQFLQRKLTRNGERRTD